MIIYGYLFYVGYKFGIKTKSFDDTPVLGGLAAVAIPSYLNVSVIWILLIYLDIVSAFEMTKLITIITALCFCGMLWTYYSYKGRYKRIVEKYDLKVRESNSLFYRLPHIVVIFLYWIISGACIFIAGWSYNNFK